MGRILNLTQHTATPEQAAAGVFEPPAETKKEIRELLTFNELPNREEIRKRVKRLAAIASYQIQKAELRPAPKAMIGGAPYLMGPLQDELDSWGIVPLYAFSRRESTEVLQRDGIVTKTIRFRHLGFVAGVINV